MAELRSECDDGHNRIIQHTRLQELDAQQAGVLCFQVFLRLIGPRKKILAKRLALKGINGAR